MADYREILKLNNLGYTKKDIASSHYILSRKISKLLLQVFCRHLVVAGLGIFFCAF